MPSAALLASSEVTRHSHEPPASALVGAQAVAGVVTDSVISELPGRCRSKRYVVAVGSASQLKSASDGGTSAPAAGVVGVGAGAVTRNGRSALQPPLRLDASTRRTRQVYGVGRGRQR